LVVVKRCPHKKRNRSKNGDVPAQIHGVVGVEKDFFLKKVIFDGNNHAASIFLSWGTDNGAFIQGWERGGQDATKNCGDENVQGP
jgi:hypothetical protein